MELVQATNGSSTLPRASNGSGSDGSGSNGANANAYALDDYTYSWEDADHLDLGTTCSVPINHPDMSQHAARLASNRVMITSPILDILQVFGACMRAYVLASVLACVLTQVQVWLWMASVGWVWVASVLGRGLCWNAPCRWCGAM